MMRCVAFRQQLGAAALTPEMLAHLRACSDCLHVAAEQDPDLWFRSLGGDELEPPGGTDLFVQEVMQQIELSDRKARLIPAGRSTAFYQWAMAAAVALTVSSFALVRTPEIIFPGTPQPAIADARQSLVERPLVESYEASGATIVDVPTDEQSNVKIVMIFDESLPVDL